MGRRRRNRDHEVSRDVGGFCAVHGAFRNGAMPALLLMAAWMAARIVASFAPGNASHETCRQSRGSPGSSRPRLSPCTQSRRSLELRLRERARRTAGSKGQHGVHQRTQAKQLLASQHRSETEI